MLTSSYSMGTWAPTSTPSEITMKSIASTVTPMVMSTLSSAYSQLSTETDAANFVGLSKIIRGGEATMTIVSAQEVLATATDSEVLSSATNAIFEATLNLKAMADDANYYHFYLNRGGNIFYFICYLCLFCYFLGMLYKSRYTWFNVTFIIGFGLEMVGFIGRLLSFKDDSKLSYYVIQSFCLTVAPAVIMAGIYFLLALLIVIHGRQYSYLKPMLYSGIFITIDILSFCIQGAGGGLATSDDPDSSKMGNNLMIAGIVVQIVGMTLFLIFFLIFLGKIYFKNRGSSSPYNKPSFMNFMRLLFNVPAIRVYRMEYLDQFYNSQFQSLRMGKLFNYFPLAMTLAVIAVYIRSVYRVVELVQGYGGYLFTHEVYLFVLDASLITVSGIIFVPFHPVWVLGKEVMIKASTIRKGQDVDASRDLSESNNDLESANAYPMNDVEEKHGEQPNSVLYK